MPWELLILVFIVARRGPRSHWHIKQLPNFLIARQFIFRQRYWMPSSQPHLFGHNIGQSVCQIPEARDCGRGNDSGSNRPKKKHRWLLTTIETENIGILLLCCDEKANTWRMLRVAWNEHCRSSPYNFAHVLTEHIFERYYYFFKCSDFFLYFSSTNCIKTATSVHNLLYPDSICHNQFCINQHILVCIIRKAPASVAWYRLSFM